MAYSYKTSLSFGLVYIPVALTAAAKPHDVGFNLLERETGKRVRNKRVAEGTDREVALSDTVKGYAYEKDRYVVFEPEEFEKIKTKSDKTIGITAFVDLKEIDPIFYEKTYYVTPTGGERAFALLLDAMTDMKKVGISKTVLGSKESLVALRAEKKKMLLSTLYFFDELAKAPELPKIKPADEKERKLAASLIQTMSEKFDPEKYKNEYNERLKAAIEDKINGKQVIAADEGEEGATDEGNLFEALLASVKRFESDSART